MEGQEFVLTTKEIEGDENRVTVHFKEITKDVNVGTTILIDDGLVALIVESIVQDEVHCRVINGGILGSRKGVNIPEYPQACLLLRQRMLRILSLEYPRI